MSKPQVIPLPSVATIEYHFTYSIITGEFYNNHNKSGRGGGINSVAGTVGNNGRRKIKIDGVRYYASRLAWKYVHGVDPTHEVDHWDNNRDNNSIINLRDVTHPINQLNRVDSKRNGGPQIITDSSGKRVCTPLGRKRNAQRQNEWYHRTKTNKHP